ncbi:GNAT family N-acetyltransferase [Proteiniclasticum ruminis]|uniref:Protein N-acetyltransferase, RimJ/RimL family n=1 Tax=Proteiniclasticum ruminis TaxID=398199 RepID=A0A1G8QN02_9CLOT|nr:GNAT family protein [Proteiniclasticum ruminis]SDJ05971.1 Protein N-acetyltransferase, RimJ/RimL family [Proteiniclasticum ruminis]
MRMKGVVRMELRTDRLILKKLDRRDAEELYRYRSKEEVLKFQSFHPRSLQHVGDFFQDLAEMPDVEDTWFQLGIHLKEEKKLIGDLGLHFLPDGCQVEIGYSLDPCYQGKGYATEAIKEILKYLFEKLQKHRVTASVDPLNENSIRLLERLGFRREAHFIKGLFYEGAWVDDVIYAMLREEWVERNQ